MTSGQEPKNIKTLQAAADALVEAIAATTGVPQQVRDLGFEQAVRTLAALTPEVDFREVVGRIEGNPRLYTEYPAAGVDDEDAAYRAAELQQALIAKGVL
ncbi:MAG TPA: hypothetical protein VMW41_00275 [Candidatus Bathyarchaeia archaeon]|nr:hypothetical protein [Candidatus Bathyarchaeia archaeon]